jgi:hypothetical protein
MHSLRSPGDNNIQEPCRPVTDLERDSWPGLLKGLSPHTVPGHSCHEEQEHSFARFLISLLLNFCKKKFPNFKEASVGPNNTSCSQVLPAQHWAWSFRRRGGQWGACLPGYCHFLSVGSWASELISEPLSTYLHDVDRNGCGGLKITLPPTRASSWRAAELIRR